MRLYHALAGAGFDLEASQFMKAYDDAHEKYRIVRYGKLTEVTNAIWISEALNSLGFRTSPDDKRIRMAVNVFFADYVNSLELRPCVSDLLKKLSPRYKTALVSNFTYAPVIYCGLRKLGISKYFNAILVSEAVGWRKPHSRIFTEALRRLATNAEETIYIGDSPLEDIKGAKAIGMRTVFVPSQFYSLGNLRESLQKPDLIVRDICALCKELCGLLCENISDA